MGSFAFIVTFPEYAAEKPLGVAMLTFLVDRSNRRRNEQVEEEGFKEEGFNNRGHRCSNKRPTEKIVVLSYRRRF